MQSPAFVVHNVDTIKNLAQIRMEWEKATNGKNLVHVQGSVGLLLADFSTAMGLTREEQRRVLGARLFKELQKILVFSQL